jgi:SAM-dependent methyltransferase
LSSIEHAWPQHRAFLARTFSGLATEDTAIVEDLARKVLLLAGDELPSFVDDYRWMCGLFLKHEIAYRRSRTTAHTDAAEILAAYYDNPGAMTRYMRGLLVSQVVWPQHLGVQIFAEREFFPRLKEGYRYLEVGPGHGITLATAGADRRCGTLSGCDISQTSIAMTRDSLTRLGVGRPVDLVHSDICTDHVDAPVADAIVLSQVLELVASPEKALDNLAARLAPGGLIFINTPVRLLAPDHIRVWNSDQEILDLIDASGLDLVLSERIHVDRMRTDESQGFSLVTIARKPAGPGS